MNHPDSEVLLARFDGELGDDVAASVARHVDHCDSCLARMVEFEATTADVAAALAAIDAYEPLSWATPFHDTPADGARVERSAGDRGPSDLAPAERVPSTAVPLRMPVRRAPVSARAWRWAAGIVLLAGAGAAAAILGRPSGGTVDTLADPVTATSIDAELPNVFHVQPVDGSIDIALTGVAGPTHIDVVFAGEGDVLIEAAGPDRLHLDNARGSTTLDLGTTPARLRMTFPANLGSATIRVDGRPLGRIDNGRLIEVGTLEGVTIAVEATGRS